MLVVGGGGGEDHARYAGVPERVRHSIRATRPTTWLKIKWRGGKGSLEGRLEGGIRKGRGRESAPWSQESGHRNGRPARQ